MLQIDQVKFKHYVDLHNMALVHLLDAIKAQTLLVVHVKVASRRAGANVSLQKFGQGTTLPLPACLLLIVHPGVMCSR